MSFEHTRGATGAGTKNSGLARRRQHHSEPGDVGELVLDGPASEKPFSQLNGGGGERGADRRQASLCHPAEKPL